MKLKPDSIWQSLLWKEQGAASVEYALLGMFIAVVIVIAVGVTGKQVYEIFTNVGAMFGGAASNGNASC